MFSSLSRLEKFIDKAVLEKRPALDRVRGCHRSK